MRSLTSFLCLLPFLLFAQPETALLRGLPFAQTEGPLIEVSFDIDVKFPGEVLVYVYDGYECGEDENRDLCYRLEDGSGDALRFPNTISALNWFERRGWQLITTSRDAGRRLVNVSANPRYLFRKQC